jgi:drug/metabolite transporter (DMT)-like permease
MWGINIPVVKYAVGQVDPFVFNATRLVFATMALGVFAWFEARQRKSIRGPFSMSRWAIFAYLTGFQYMIFFMLGVSRTSAGNAALLLSSMPMWTAALSFLFIGERLKRANWIGLGITFVGTLTVILFGREKINLSSGFLVGNLFMMSGAITWASGTIISRKLLESIGPMTLAFTSALATTPFHVGIAAAGFRENLPMLIQPHVLIAILYSGVFSTGLAYALWHVGVRQLGGSHASIYQNFVTLVAVLGGWLFLAEAPMLSQIVGGILIILGVLIMRSRR